jgi:acyl-CoA thioester hydrolase
VSISFVDHRVNYSETDQMGFVYHANYLVWLDIARTEHLRQTGVTYKDMEERGVFLAVTEARIRYRKAARYDDVVRIKCWVRDLASRRVVFGYAVERAETAELLATAETALIALDRQRVLARVPADITERLHAIPDPVRL